MQEERPGGRAGPDPWLLVFNCQVLGLANSLSLLCDQIQVEHYDPSSFRKHSDEILLRWASFDRILIAPQLESMLPVDLRGDPRIWRIPTISFAAYDPDICYLRPGNAGFKGPMGDYHSTIAFAAFQSGLSVSATVGMYNEVTYENLGYFHCWDEARANLLETYALAGLDLREKFVNWSRDGAFMYSNNHAQVRCLHDVAKEILKLAGKTAAYDDVRPHDNLLNGPVYPVYPEIGQRLGVDGSYRFKVGGQYRTLDLENFIEQSFRCYASTSEISILPAHSRRLGNALVLVERMM